LLQKGNAQKADNRKYLSACALSPLLITYNRYLWNDLFLLPFGHPESKNSIKEV